MGVMIVGKVAPGALTSTDRSVIAATDLPHPQPEAGDVATRCQACDRVVFVHPSGLAGAHPVVCSVDLALPHTRVWFRPALRQRRRQAAAAYIDAALRPTGARS